MSVSRTRLLRSTPTAHSVSTALKAPTTGVSTYLAVSLLPLTGFFLAAVALRLRVTATHWNGVVFTSQILTSPIILRQLAGKWYMHRYGYNKNGIGTALGFYTTYLGIWNLDFFRMVYFPFCLHPRASTLLILSLDYIIAAYPLVLIIVTHVLVTLHYRNCTLIVYLWKPFQVCCIRFRRQWNIQNSLVDAFATFLLLSYMKFVLTSCDLLIPTTLYHSESNHDTTVLYYDGNIGYFGRDHLPYAVLAIVVVLVFVLLPILLLCLYPCLWFQSILNRYHLRSQALNTFMDTFQGSFKDGTQALNTFMDTFQGSFKDGTNGTRDYRYFAAVYLIARVVVHISLVLGISNTGTSISVLICMILLICILQPYKNSLFNNNCCDSYCVFYR